MEITPPISPRHETERDPLNVLKEKGHCGFHCVGEDSKKSPLDARGFLRTGDGDLRSSNSTDSAIRHSFVNVFGQLFDLDCTCKDDLNRLFQMTRNRIGILDAAQKMNSGTYGLLAGAVHDETPFDLNQIRQELREFFYMLRILLNTQSVDEEYLWLLKELIPVIVKGLRLIRTQLGWLSDLPSYVLGHAHIRANPKSTSSAAFHLFHCHLELRWLYISVLWTLNSCVDAASRLETLQSPSYFESFLSETNFHNLLESAIQFCTFELVEMAVVKFNKLKKENVPLTALFNCMCVKELWLLLRFATEALNNYEVKSFWKLIGNIIEILVKDDTAQSCSKSRGQILKVPNQISCSDPCLFTLWFLYHVTDLFCYSNDGCVWTPMGNEMDGGQLILKRVLSGLNGSHDSDEAQRRVLIRLLKSLMVEPWKPRPEPIMMLWEGFCRILDSAFQIPGSLASSYVIACETIQDILDSLDYDDFSKKTKKTLNSFEMFLSILGNFLKNDPTQWKLKLCGRFWSKLSERKVDGLSEIGLYHLSQLFLTIALAIEDLEELGLQFQKLVRFHDSNEKRNCMVMKCQLCFVYLFAQTNKPVGPLICPLTEKIEFFMNVNQYPVVHAYIEGLLHVIRNCQLPSDLYLISGEWVKQFLKESRPDTITSYLNLMVDIMLKVQMNKETTVGAGVEKLVQVLCENLLPYVKEQRHTSVEQIADLAVYFTIAALEYKNSVCNKESFRSLLNHFMISDSSNVLLVRRFLYKILSFSQIHNILEENEDQQILFTQAWIRYSASSVNYDQDEDKFITRYILRFPLLHSLLSEQNVNVMNLSDPLVYFLEMLGNNDKGNKKMFITLVEPLKLLLPMLRSTLFPAKLKESSWKSEKHVFFEPTKDVIVRTFFIFGKLMCHCSSLLYEKNTSSNFLITIITSIIIPQKVFDMDVRLPLAMDEGLRKSLPLFLKGLHGLDPTKEKCIQRFFSEIVTVYIPRFGVQPHNSPFVKIWDDPEDMPLAIYIIHTVCSTLLRIDARSNLPHKYYSQGLTFVNELLKRGGNENDDVLLEVLVENVFPSCLEVIAKATDIGASSRRKETEKTLRIMFETNVYLSQPNLWEQTNTVLGKLADKYLRLSHETFFRMLHFLKKEFRHVFNRFDPTLIKKCKEVQTLKAAGSDKKFETQLNLLRGE